ncbi:glycerate kinase (plasmid) [Fulvitalea axinellae]|uniref:Glycerate kinase n=1 Tax=Fulvitalea axinellae TaxID=1182444 RepID=A0AAU9CHI1_9BACT|nr:glycerate kinase [Fulvitalea axinellae]
MKVLIATDKFKGAMDNFQASSAMRKGVLRACPDAEITTFSLSDGGEGFLELFRRAKELVEIRAETFDPLGRKIEASFLYDNKQQEAVVELASASGLMLLAEEERCCAEANTFGSGILIRKAIESGAKRIILGLGGSASNDAGLGIAKALGVKILSGNGEEIKPCGKNLSKIHKLDFSQVPDSVKKAEILLACDVQNPFTGPEGAVNVYSEQKGANECERERMEYGMKHLLEVFKKEERTDISNLEGAGAAGGCSGGLVALFDAKIVSGAELAVEYSGFVGALGSADLVLTGEGSFDKQSLRGKLVSIVTKVAHRYGVPVAGFFGKIDPDVDPLDVSCPDFCGALGAGPISLKESVERSQELLEARVLEVIKLLKRFV